MTQTPKEVFEQHIECVRRGDRKAQMELYHDDLIAQFPFAIDRDHIIFGKDNFLRIMAPLWAQAEAAGVKITDYDSDVHQSADDPEIIFAEFTFTIESPAGSRQITFVQKTRIVDGKIASINEYSVPSVSSTFNAKSGQ